MKGNDYMNTGAEQRLEIMLKEFNSRISGYFKQHGWDANVINKDFNNEILFACVIKNSISKNISMIYSVQTNKSVYAIASQKCDLIIVHGVISEGDKHWYSEVQCPVIEINNIIDVIRDWNEMVDNIKVDDTKIIHKKPDIIRMLSDNPSEQVMMLLQSLTSKEIAIEILKDKFNNIEISDEIVFSKAEGISLLIQNAIDYFNSDKENLTKRLLNLYYGTVAFIEAEILAAPNHKFVDLGSVEKITTNGHGLYTVDFNGHNIKNLYIGILEKGRGLFPEWLDSRGIKADDFSKKRAKENNLDPYCVPFVELLERIPELSTLLMLSESNYRARYIQPVFAQEMNRQFSLKAETKSYVSQKNGSYVKLYDYTDTIAMKDIYNYLGPISQIEEVVEKDNYNAYSFLVEHSDDEYWWQKLNIHKSSFSRDMILESVLGRFDDWEIFAVMILYALSILVRYRPNLWGNVLHGTQDRYGAVFSQFAKVCERELPHIFFEKIYGKKLSVTQPGSIF